eukprot:1160368-Pelagomonas_calceolata.AAC.2
MLDLLSSTTSQQTEVFALQDPISSWHSPTPIKLTITCVLRTFHKPAACFNSQVLHGILSDDPRSSGGLSTRAQDLLEEFVCHESWQLLSHRLLSLMGDDELLEVRRRRGRGGSVEGLVCAVDLGSCSATAFSI